MRLFRFQLAIIVVGLSILLVQPPAYGRMLLIPADGDQAASVRLALDSGATLVGPGPFAGSLIVEGESARLGWPLVERGVLAIAGVAGGCGEGPGA